MITDQVTTQYANTDFDLKSATPFDTLNRELSATCCVLSYTAGEDGNWHAIVESKHDECTSMRNAELDIIAMMEATNSLSPEAVSELQSCYLREFNIGIHCGDTWAYIHRIPTKVVQAIADVGCSLAVTVYPMRKPDGTLRE